MPVLPDVGSTIVPPGRSAPLCSAASTIAIAMRSLIDPPGFARSLFTQTFAPLPNSRLMRMCGVLPIVSRMLSARMGVAGGRYGRRLWGGRPRDLHPADRRLPVGERGDLGVAAFARELAHAAQHEHGALPHL